MKNIRRHLVVGCVLLFLVFSYIPSTSTQDTSTRTISVISEPISEERVEYRLFESIGRPVSECDLTPEMQTVIEYDPISKEETIHNEISDFLPLNVTQIEPHDGLNYFLEQDRTRTDPNGMVSGLRSSHVFPPDDRSRVSPTTSFPWSSICKIISIAANGSRYIGSGAIIDNFHVLTCGHNVYKHDAGGWVSKLTAIPGIDGLTRPYLSAEGVNFRSYTGWTQDELPGHDWALVTLDRSLGLITGWMGRKTEASSHSIYSGEVNTAGYPGDLYFGQFMYYTNDTGNGATEYRHYYWLDTAGGQSGSPVWQFDGSNQYILAIHAYSQSGAGANFGTRLNTDKFDQLNTWLADDATTPPNDLPDLDVKDILIYPTPDIVNKNRTELSLWVTVFNYGVVASTSTTMKFYLSENSMINQSDFLLGTDSITAMSALNSQDGRWEGIVPMEVPDGEYYIGAIVDPDTLIDEYDETNNALVYQDMIKIETYVPPTLFEKILNNPLWLGLSIGGISIILGGTTAGIVISVRKKKRKM